MKLDVHLHATLQRLTPQGLVRQLAVEMPPGSTLGELLAMLDIPLPVDGLMLAVNFRVADVGQALADGDRVNIMPAISGGEGVRG